MTELDLAYFAGVLDDSCCITIRHRHDRKTRPVQLFCHITRQDRTVPYLLAERFGGSVTAFTLRGKVYFRWCKVGKEAQAVLRELYPYLRVRRAEVDRFLSVVVPNKGGRRVHVRPDNWKDLEARA